MPADQAEDDNEGNIEEAYADEGEVFVPNKAEFEKNEIKQEPARYCFKDDESQREKHLLNWY